MDNDLVRDHLIGAGRLDRRTLVRRGLALGAVIPAIGSLPAGELTVAPRVLARMDALAARQGEPREGGRVVYGIENQLQQFHYNTPWVAEAQMDLYERLLAIDYEGNLVPYLAESFELADDGLAVTMSLQAGKTFHDGEPVDAAAVKALFDRWISPESDYTETYFANVAEVQAPDERTVVFRLKERDSNAVYGLAYVYSPIVSVKALEANPDEFGKSVVVGSGPFTFESWEGDSVTVVRNPTYSGPPPFVTNKGAPYLDSITYTWLPDQSTRTINLESGEFDIVEKPAPQDIARLEANPDIVVVKQPQTSLLYLGFNFKRQEKLGDKRVREAIYRAVDRQAIIDNLLFGLATPAYSPVVPHDPDHWAEAPSLYPLDLDAARTLLDEAGWMLDGDVRAKDGQELSLNLIIVSNSEQELVAQVIQTQLAEIGVVVEIEVLDKGTHQQRQLDGDYDLNFFRYTYDSSIQVLKILYGSAAMPPNGANWAFYNNPRADEFFASFRSATTPEARSESIVGVQKVLLEDVALVPIYSPLGIWAMRQWVQGFTPNPQAMYPLHNDLWVTGDSPRAE
jgi:peptide/nickel transport system substrate-binding protein